MIFKKKETRTETEEELLAKLKALKDIQKKTETEEVEIKPQKKEKEPVEETYIETYARLEAERVNIMLQILEKQEEIIKILQEK